MLPVSCGILLLLSCNVAVSAGVQPVTQNLKIHVLQDIQSKTIKIKWDNPNKAKDIHVTVDDDPYFKSPILKQSVSGQDISIDMLKQGIFPGIPYYVLIEPGNLRGTFRFGLHEWNNLLGGPDFLYREWEATGRKWLERHAGVKWNIVDHSWVLIEQWPTPNAPDGEDVCPHAYHIEPVIRGAVNVALVDHNVGLMDELADFYLTYLKRFVTLGALRSIESSSNSIRRLRDQGPDSTMTLQWIEKGVTTEKGPLTNDVREGALYNTQFFHPVSRLIRVLSTLPESEMTPRMKRFIGAYLPIVVHDHLIRFGYVAYWDYWGAKELPKKLVDIWQKIINTAPPYKLSYQYGMHDWDLWIIATAAEMLGANANNPNLVPISQSELSQLKKIVQIGVKLFKTKQEIYRDTHDFNGKKVISVSYLNGVYDDHPDMQYAGYQGVAFPTPAEKKPPRGGGSDISHFHRVPIFMRSLYDNKNAAGLTYPDAMDIEQLINQYMYRVFYGDLNRPLFRNFFDGSDGWFRVGYHGQNFGYPPAKQCDEQAQDRPCMALAAAFGWGLLSPFDDNLMRLERSYIDLAISRDPEVKSFRNRYYYYNGQRFALTDEDGKMKYPISLFFILSAVAEKML